MFYFYNFCINRIFQNMYETTLFGFGKETAIDIMHMFK